jgi:hypothetical protein
MGNKTGASLRWHKKLDKLPDFGPGLALLWRIARLLLLVHVHWHERVATVGDFYTGMQMQDLSDHLI